MLFNLSLKNIKKSLKDYSIYFFTLVIAVAIFYIFNSLDSQSSMLIANNIKHTTIENLIQLLSYVSVFVSVILGFLIVYSNNFLIKRRKKEIGLYLTLGMSKRKVSMIFVLETFIVGIVSLGVGLLIGVGLSQFLSIVTCKLFEVNMSDFKFVFSEMAFYKTLIYFGIIFVLVMIFNIFSLSRNKLIDLLNASKQNEKVKFRNKWVTLISFIISIGLITYAYKLLLGGTLLMMDNQTLVMVICGAIATYLFFFSLSGFLLTVLQKTKLYYKNLNMFTLKQVNNRVNTSVFSTTIICLMLLLTIGILSGSLSLSNAFNQNITDSNITDFTINEYVANCIVREDGPCKIQVVDPTLKNITTDKKFNEYTSEYVYYDLYFDEDLTMNSMLSKKEKDKLIAEYGDALSVDSQLNIITESDYNEIAELYGIDKVHINDNQYILSANIESVTTSFKDYYENDGRINVNNYELTPQTKEMIPVQLENYSTLDNMGTVIVKDKTVDGLVLLKTVIIGNYNEKNDELVDEEFRNYVREKNITFSPLTRIQMKDNGVGLKVILTFIGLYLGIVFAISSVTILAIQQLSESSDNKERYKVLRQIGADEKMINKALFMQIAITFLFPLVVALFHAIFGLKELNKLIQVIGNLDLASNILLTSLFIIIVYGGYFITTYLCSKTIIKD